MSPDSINRLTSSEEIVKAILIVQQAAQTITLALAQLNKQQQRSDKEELRKESEM
jgi:hypothetical protein